MVVGSTFSPGELRVIIPVGGVAKRLLPLTAEVSKACVRLVNVPLVEISLLTLAKQGVRNFIFGVKGYTNYRSLYDHFESGVGFSAKYGIAPRVHIKYQPNIDDYGSADSVRINIEYYDIKDPIFAVQGDNIFDIDLESMLRFHQEKKAFLTVGLMPVSDVTGYGVAKIDNDLRISKFVEKPSPKEAPSNLANTGLYLFSPEVKEVFKESGVQEIMHKNKRLDFGYDFIPYLIETGRPVYGYVLSGVWYDVGTPERYLEAMRGILDGKLRALQDFGGRISEGERIWIQGESPEALRRREEIIRRIREGRIEVEGSVLIGRHCEISDGARIVNSCIDNYVRIGRNAVIENSAVMDRSAIGESAEIKDSIVGRHVTVNSSQVEKTRILNVSVIADDAFIDAGCEVVSTKIYPYKHITKQSLYNSII
ncbi:MAG: NDP-sugar synthase [Candidatus Bathyarchaeia archaeon]